MSHHLNYQQRVMSASSKTRTLTNSPTSGHSARPSGTRTPSQGISSETNFIFQSITIYFEACFVCVKNNHLD